MENDPLKFKDLIKNEFNSVNVLKENDRKLMKEMELNFRKWEDFLYVLCAFESSNYYKTIEKILKESGFENINYNKVKVYMNRIRNKKS